MAPLGRRGCGNPSPEEQRPVATADVRPSPGGDPTGDRSDLAVPDLGGDEDQAGPGHNPDGDPPRVGPYRLIRRLGQGSQGEVWRAVRLNRPFEEVALKLLRHCGQRHPRTFARFRHEAERGALLGGRGILPIFEFGQDGQLAFLAMPLVEGSALSQVLDQRRWHRAGRPAGRCHRLALLAEPLYADAVARALADVARALGEAHAARVVHCDVKPANILVERGVGGRAYLIDFGLGRDLDAMLATGPVKADGTLLYMAPEKLSGRRADEALCDIYGLGATGFEALALRPPLQVPEGLPRPLWSGYLAKMEPPRLGAIVPRLPEDLGAIVARAMARDPRRRYQSALAMARDLDRYLGDAAGR
jgi:eukaryotic-like serine/threonine-protein kinase